MSNIPTENSTSEVSALTIMSIILLVVFAAFVLSYAIGFFAPFPYYYLCGVPIFLLLKLGSGEPFGDALFPTLFYTILILASSAMLNKVYELRKNSQQSVISTEGSTKSEVWNSLPSLKKY